MRRRTGFTLVEVLVAMALTLFIMSILSAAFVAATSAVSDLKAAGDLAERLRGAANVLRRDLEADHCYSDANATQIVRLSNLWATGLPPTSGFFRIYQGGPAQAMPAGPPVSLPPFTNFDEGVDLDGIHSYISTNHALHYTIGLHGTLRSDFLSAWVPGSPLVAPSLNPVYLPPNDYPDHYYQDTAGVYNAQTAEVAIFLAPNGDLTDPTTPPALPLYGLYRRQMLTVPSSWTQPAGTPPGLSEVSTVPILGEAVAPSANLSGYNTLQSLNVPVKRFWMNRAENVNGVCTQPEGLYQAQPAGSTAFRYPMLAETDPTLPNADLLLSDVVSFDVRVLVDPTTHGATDFGDLYQLTGATSATEPSLSTVASPFAAFPFNWPPTIVDPNTGQPPRVFDTWTSAKDTIDATPAYDYSGWQTAGTATSIPIFKDANGHPIIIRALQITLRVWDFKTKKTRQVTIVQQM